MLRRLLNKKDFYAGGLLILFGLGAALKGPDYGSGTLMHMGPGFMPTALGVILVAIGLFIAGAAAMAPGDEPERILPEQKQWFAWGCILAGPALFVLVGSYFGMLPGTFACVFVSAMGDKTQTWKSALVLASVVSVFGVILFAYFLQVPMPVFAWLGSSS